MGAPRHRVHHRRRTLTRHLDWAADEYREVDDERVLVSFRCSGRGKTSGLDLAQMHPLMAGVFHLREGMVTRFVGYIDYAEALEAVGLRE